MEVSFVETAPPPTTIPTAVPTTGLPPNILPPESATESAAVVDPTIKNQMTFSFAEQSGMNAEWSLKYVHR